MKNPAPAKPIQSEGEVNTSLRREQWANQRHDNETQSLLQRDADLFLHQSVSTPCVNTIAKAEGAYIEDLQGKRYLDFHGNNVHHIGYGHPELKQAITEANGYPAVCTPALCL